MSKNDNGEEKQSFIEKVAAFIVDKRKAFYLVYIGKFLNSFHAGLKGLSYLYPLKIE